MLKPPQLPSTGFHGRLTKALSAWLELKGKVGQVGPQMALRKAIHALGYKVPSKGSISEWIAGTKVPKLDHCFVLALALGQPPAWLAFDDGNMVSGARGDAPDEYEPPATEGDSQKRIG